MLSTLKAKLIAAGTILVGILLATIKYLTAKNSKLRREIEHKEAVIHQKKVIAKKDREREGRTQSRRAEARNEIKTTGSTDAFRDPNSLRNRGSGSDRK